MRLCLGKAGHHSCQISSLGSFHLSVVVGLQISPLGTEQPHRLQHPPPAGRNPEQKSAGMFEMLICRSSLLAAWREEERAEVAQI